MNDVDGKKLEELYESVLNEMAYRPLMPYHSVMPSVTKVKNVAKTEQELEERKIQAGLKIRENLNILENDKENFSAAWDIINIMNNFVEKGEYREEFLVGDVEMTYVEVLQKILDLMKTKENDPDLLLTGVGSTGDVVKGMTVDEYVRGDDKRTNEHYYLFRRILDSLPDTKTTRRSRRESELGRSKISEPDPLFYFAEKFDVYIDGIHVGYKTGKQFWPTDEGRLLKYEEVVPAKFKRFQKEHDTFRLENRRLEPFITYIFDEGEPIDMPILSAANRRRPRRMGDPVAAPPAWQSDSEYSNQYKPANLMGRTVAEIKSMLHSDEAEKKFRELYPESDYKYLYKRGKLGGTVSLPPV